MNVRHLVAAANVDASGRIVDPRRVRHGVLRAGRVWALAGEVDPQTHLNLDFPYHALGLCVVVEALAAGSAALAGEGSFRQAAASPAAGAHRGVVDVDARRREWLVALRARRERAS